MKRSKFDETRDQRVADEAGTPQHLLCAAHGCPNRWSNSIGHVCRWHADADKERWPEVTQQQQWDETERARMRAEPAPYVEPLRHAEKRAILAKFAAVLDRTGQDPKAWAKRLRHRERRGERLSGNLRTMWRAALGVHAEGVESGRNPGGTISEPEVQQWSAA